MLFSCPLILTCANIQNSDFHISVYSKDALPARLHALALHEVAGNEFSFNGKSLPVAPVLRRCRLFEL